MLSGDLWIRLEGMAKLAENLGLRPHLRFEGGMSLGLGSNKSGRMGLEREPLSQQSHNFSTTSSCCDPCTWWDGTVSGLSHLSGWIDCPKVGA